MTDAAKPTKGPCISEQDYPAVTANGVDIALCNAHPLPRAERFANAALIAEAFNVHHETGLTPRQLAEQRDELLAALKSLASFTDGNICRHETTHRGGLIWEICDDCGARWADDTGGKPDACDPASLTAARAIIDKVEAKS